MDWDDKHRAYRLLRATLHALRDRLTAHEAVQFGAQLPMFIRGFYYDGWHMRDRAPQSGPRAHFSVMSKQRSSRTRTPTPKRW